jgi:hypothetical protein
MHFLQQKSMTAWSEFTSPPFTFFMKNKAAPGSLKLLLEWNYRSRMLFGRFYI